MDHFNGKGNTIVFMNIIQSFYQNIKIIIDKPDNTKEEILINQGVFLIDTF
jgi:hypothetical protein